jgi:cytochrome c-type biogenesis protein CcmH/NrfG
MRARRIVIAVAVLAVGCAAVAFFLRGRRHDPVPEFDLSGAEPAVRSTIETARERVVKDPSSGRAWGRLGQALLANGYDEEAMSVFEQAARLDPEEPRWPYLRARRLLLVDRARGTALLEHAVRLAERADPDNRACKLLLCEALVACGDHERAEALAREVLAKEPDNPRAHFYLGACHLNRDEPKESLPHFLRAAESPYTRKRACEQLAAVSLRLDDAAAAEQYARKARELPADLAPIDPYASEYQDLAAGRLAKFREAERLEAEQRLRDSARILQDLAESTPDAHSEQALGIALIKLGDNAAGEKILRQAVAKDPECSAAYYALAVAQFNQAEQLSRRDSRAAAIKYDEAEQSALRAVASKPDHANAYLFLGRARLGLGRRDDAVAAFRRAIACRPELAGPHLSLGEALAKAGDKEQARRELQLAIDLAAPYDPAGPRARELLEELQKP